MIGSTKVTTGQIFPQTACRSWQNGLELARLLALLVCCGGALGVLAGACRAQDDASVQDDVDSSSGLAVLAALETATVSAIERAESSVVAISRVRRDRAPGVAINPMQPGALTVPFLAQQTPHDPDFIPSFFGSGIVISDDGYIVTCGHVLDDPRENDYTIWLNKESYAARVVGLPAKVMASDPFSDLAVLKIEASNLKPVKFSQTELRKGQFVLALGNPLAIARDGRASASWGIISNLNRFSPNELGSGDATKETIHHYGTLIQTDAKLNLGMSGGALINLKGEVVGLTTALAAVSGQEQSAGFAIAADAMFQRAIDVLKSGKLPEFGFLGIQPEDVRSTDKSRGFHGARVSVVIPGLPGELAGLRAEDVIFKVAGRPIQDRNDLFRELSQAPAGDQVELMVQRFRPGRNSPDVLRLPAVLSKKPMATRRPGFASNSQPRWRGMLVEYATAIPTELSRVGLGGGRLAPKLAILSVDPDTQAWQAGLRPGFGVMSVAGTRVETPADFYRIMADHAGEVPVELVVIRSLDRPETVVVQGQVVGQ